MFLACRPDVSSYPVGFIYDCGGLGFWTGLLCMVDDGGFSPLPMSGPAMFILVDEWRTVPCFYVGFCAFLVVDGYIADATLNGEDRI